MTNIAATTYTSASLTYAAAPETYIAAALASFAEMKPTRILRFRLSVKVVRPLVEFNKKLGMGGRSMQLLKQYAFAS